MRFLLGGSLAKSTLATVSAGTKNREGLDD